MAVKLLQASNRGIGAGFLPDPYPEFGQCVHKIASHPDAPGRMCIQPHHSTETVSERRDA